MRYRFEYSVLLAYCGNGVQCLKIIFLGWWGYQRRIFYFDSNSGRIGYILGLIVLIVLEKTTPRSEDLTRGDGLHIRGLLGVWGLTSRSFSIPHLYIHIRTFPSYYNRKASIIFGEINYNLQISFYR